MAHTLTTVKLGRQGRLVVPAALRKELGLEIGDELVARVEAGKLVFEPRAALVERVRARFEGVEASLATELIRDRKEEAASEGRPDA